ncbi:MAG: DUF86 domain-containing protein [Methanomicrobiaceae archaeon]|nr:DUF86 domain-containing protein [Methanomicrobiaceae archaeon]
MLPPDPGAALGDLADFRNVLIHIYWQIDLKEAYGILQDDLTAAREFEKIVLDYLRRA